MIYYEFHLLLASSLAALYAWKGLAQLSCLDTISQQRDTDGPKLESSPPLDSQMVGIYIARSPGLRHERREDV